MQETTSFGIAISFLTGRYVATSHNDRRQAEWPPHPARLFAALVATWADSDEPDQDERRLLEWLEALGPPAIAAEVEAVPRKVASHFVPVNDTTIVGHAWHRRRAEDIAHAATLLHDELVASAGEITPKVDRLRKKVAKHRDVRAQVSDVGKTNADTAWALLPDRRGKRERHFPSVTISLPAPTNANSSTSPQVTFIWERHLPAKERDILDGLLARVTRLGHSSSLVSCRVVKDTPDATLLPSLTGNISLRHVRRGQLAELERLFARHQGIDPRALPYTEVRYGEPSSEQAVEEDRPNTAGQWTVFEFLPSSRAFPATRTVEVATALRSAVLSYAKDPPPEELSGHQPDGRATTQPHVAFLPLPFAGYAHGDGRLLGIAISAPEGMDEASARVLYQAIGRWERQVGADELALLFGKRGEIRIRRLRGLASMTSLRRDVWSRSCTRWASVTPIALPKHPGRLRSGTATARARAWKSAEEAVRSAVLHVGLPEPSAVEVALGSAFVGARAASAYPSFRQPGKDGTPVRRQLVHAVVTFERPVLGPLMLGSGRFVGLGLMRPLPYTSRDGKVSDSTQGGDHG